MQEIEAKFYVQDLEKIEMRLQDLEARLIQPHIFETNIRFDLPDGGLRSEGRVLRLRQDSEARLTYKDSGTHTDGIINRTEIEFTVDDFEKAKLFLEALGYRKLAAYEKHRTTYELQSSEGSEPSEGFIHIMLDELPYGNFVEIEGGNTKTIRAVSEQLNLNWNAIIATGYLDLFQNVRRALNLSFTDLTFENFNGIKITPAHLQVQPADNVMES